MVVYVQYLGVLGGGEGGGENAGVGKQRGRPETPPPPKNATPPPYLSAHRVRLALAAIASTTLWAVAL